jgi:hypothetical protein
MDELSSLGCVVGVFRVVWLSRTGGGVGCAAAAWERGKYLEEWGWKNLIIFCLFGSHSSSSTAATHGRCKTKIKDFWRGITTTTTSS